MFSRPKNWISVGLWKPKSSHSLDHLKYLYAVLCKNQTVTDQNRALLVETLRSIAELLIWGDQNDSSVFDFFLEKNMLAFFLRFMRQKSGKYICVQLLQTLNILFENINNKTSIYYLLSNNHINSIIVHKFDFSDEEVMAYYISFLKTLSLKLNRNTIHFFYNEHTNDFALYTEAIKFFNHPESMVRIAVRTITLNVYKVDEKSMLRYIRDKTAAPYFSNLVWFIGNHVLELDSCVRHDIDHNSRGRLSDLVAEHLDHLHYLNDILCLNIEALNEVLTDHLLNRLLIPLYVYSLTKKKGPLLSSEKRTCVSPVVSLFLLSQVFLIMHHAPLVRMLADIILNGDMSVCYPDGADSSNKDQNIPGFSKPPEPIEMALDKTCRSSKTTKEPSVEDEDVIDKDVEEENFETVEETVEYNDEQKPENSATLAISEEAEDGQSSVSDDNQVENIESVEKDNCEEQDKSNEAVGGNINLVTGASDGEEIIRQNQNSTDEEKLQSQTQHTTFALTNRPYLEAIFRCFDCVDSDYEVLFALCLLYALGNNNGINQEILDTMLMPTDKSPTKSHYNTILIDKLIQIISNSCQRYSRIRLTTLELSILLLKSMVCKDNQCYLQDHHLAAILGAREEATLLLRNFYKVWEKSEEIFLDMFEDEYREMMNHPLNVEYLAMDASILLPPTGTPLTGIEFKKRLPCGEVERARRAIRVFFHLRDLSLTLKQETEHQLPLTKQEECVNIGDILDLNNSDLIACTVIQKEGHKERRFLVIDVLQLILVEPDSKKLGWGVVKFVGFLQDVEVTGDKEDSRSLHVTIHKPAINRHTHVLPLLCARFIFDDHIRCMAAKQRLTKGRLRARQRKMQMIARLLELPSYIVDSIYQPSTAMATSAATLRTSVSSGALPTSTQWPNTSSGAIPGRSHPVAQRSMEAAHPPLVRTNSDGIQNSRDATIASNTRQLPRHLASKQSRSITVRGGHPGGASRQRPVQDNVQRVMEEAGVSYGSTDVGSQIEQAEEAVPSPEAHARQSLNPQPDVSQLPEGRARSSRSSSLDSNGSHGHQEAAMIPLEDLSKKSARSSKHGDSAQKLQNSYEGKKVRSGSASPRRTRKSSGSASPRGRSKVILSASKTGKDGTQDDSASTSPPVDQLEVTSFIKDTGGEKSSKSNQVRTGKGQSRERRLSETGATCPKSLTPAPEPSLSLVISCEGGASTEAPGLGSPKLLPPADPEQVLAVNGKALNVTDSESQGTDAPSSSRDTGQEDSAPDSAAPEGVKSAGDGDSDISTDLSKAESVKPSDTSPDHQPSDLTQQTDDNTAPQEPEQNTDKESERQPDSASSVAM